MSRWIQSYTLGVGGILRRGSIHTLEVRYRMYRGTRHGWTAADRSHITVTHTGRRWRKNEGLPGSFALLFAERQHIIKLKNQDFVTIWAKALIMPIFTVAHWIWRHSNAYRAVRASAPHPKCSQAIAYEYCVVWGWPPNRRATWL